MKTMSSFEKPIEFARNVVQKKIVLDEKPSRERDFFFFFLRGEIKRDR